MKTPEDALALSQRSRDNFYVTAYRIECWLGNLVCNAVADYAEKKSAGDRRLQIGEARRIFGEVFGHATNSEFPALFRNLTRFAQVQGPYGWAVGQAYGAMSKEADFPPLRRLLSRDGSRADIQFQRRFVNRLCDWLDAITHWRAHKRYHLSPASFDRDADKRELAAIGWQQRHFSKLDRDSKTSWEWHHSLAAQRFENSEKWPMIGIAMSSQTTRYHAYPVLDELVIYFWPLVKKHNWTYRDLLNVIWAITAQPKRYACRHEQELAAYCNNVLGLRKEGTGRTSRDGKPSGWQVAMRLCRRH